MCNRGKFKLDITIIAEFSELLGIKITSIICNDVVRHAEATSYSFEELNNSFSCLISDWYGFDPFGELVDCDQ
jgi:hypothetical protein